MKLKQLSVFLENREGRLSEVLRILAENKINIVAVSLADTSDYGLLRMIVSEPLKGCNVLREDRKSDDNRSHRDSCASCNRFIMQGDGFAACK